jgi:hypothetical protein
MVRRTVEEAGGFEERRRGQRFKLTLGVQLNDGNRDHPRYQHIENFL